MTDPITLPDTTLDLSPYDIQVYDYDYVDKDTGKNRALEDWSQRLMQFAQVIEHYLNEARNVPDTVRNQLQDLVDDVRAAEQAVRNHIASVRLPLLEDGNELMLMRVNDDATEYEVVHPSQLFSGWMQSLTVNVDGQELPVISSPNVVLPEFGEYNLNSSDDYDRFIARLGDAMKAAVSAEQHRDTASGYIRQSSEQAAKSKYWAEESEKEATESKRFSDLGMRHSIRAETAAMGAAEEASRLFKQWTISRIGEAKQWADTAKGHADRVGNVVWQCNQQRMLAEDAKDESKANAEDAYASFRLAKAEAMASDQSARQAELSENQAELKRVESEEQARLSRSSAVAAETAEQTIKSYYERMNWAALTGVMTNASALIGTQHIILREHMA